MKGKRFWMIYLLLVVAPILGAVYVTGSSIELPFVLTEAQMRALAGEGNIIHWEKDAWCQAMTGCPEPTGCFNQTGTVNGKQFKSYRVYNINQTWYRCVERNGYNCYLREPWVNVCWRQYWSQEGCTGNVVYIDTVPKPGDCTGTP